MSGLHFDSGSPLSKAAGISLDGQNLSPMAKALADLREAGDDLATYLEAMKSIRWEDTSLGPLDNWSQELTTQFHLMMLNSTAQNLILGDDTIVVYNEAYAEIIRDHHPSYFGTSITSWHAWEPYFPAIKRVVEQAANFGRAVEEKDFLMYLPKNGLWEEISLLVMVIRLPTPLAGFLTTIQENTTQMVRDRRISSLKEFSECWKPSESLDELWTKILHQLSERSKQFSFTALYTATLASEAGNTSDSSSGESEDVAYVLHPDSQGYDDTPDYLRVFELSTNTEPFIALTCKSHTTRAPVLMSRQDIPEIWQRTAKSQGFEDEIQHAVILPSSSNKLSKVQAFLILGLSTRRRYDDGYKTFLLEVQRLLADSVNNLISAQESFKKRRDLAKRARIEKELMQKELELRKEQAELAQLKVGRLASTAESVEVGVFEQKISGDIVEANEAYYRISGLERAAINVAEAFKKTIFEEDLPAITAEWKALAAGENRTFELRYRNGNYGLAACVPLRDQDENVVGINGVLTNITAVKRVDANERRYHKFLEVVPSAILIVDSIGRVIFANDDWFKLSDHPRVPLDNINWLDVVPSDVQPFLLQKFKEVAAGNEISFELKMKRQHVNVAGEVCGPAWVMVKALAETNEDGGVERCVTTAMDISHQKYAESIQRIRLEEALEAKRQQENFVDLVSHEIRNPLSAIVHCADSITESLDDMDKLVARYSIPNGLETKDQGFGPLNEAINSSQDAVETISSCAAHLRAVVDDVLTLSKLDSNMLKIAPIAVSSERLIQDIYNMFRVEAEREEIAFEAQVDQSIKQLNAEWVLIDPGRVTQVILNLVGNALKFSKKEDKPVRSVKVAMGISKTRPTDTIPVDWTIASGLRDNVFDNAQFAGNESCYLWFKVTDTGCGMTAEEKSRIFTRFSQGSIKTHSTYGGSGLGLTICRTLVELQGGEIGVATESGVGSTFSFYVMTRTTEPPEADSAPLLRVRSSKANVFASAAGTTEEPISVLIVEDNLINQRVLKQQLTKQGYVTHVANNGQEALDFLETTRHWSPQGLHGSVEKRLNDVDVILSDMEMPIMDGLTLARRVRALQKNGEITTECLPIISVSANARAEQIRMAIEAGMDDSISKPFRIPDLTPKINRLAKWARSKGRT